MPVNRTHLCWLAAVVVLGGFAPSARSQGAAPRPAPHLAYAYPAGGQQGTTFTVSLGGQNFTGATEVFVSGPGVTAKVTAYDRPLTQKELNDLRDTLQQLQEKRAAAGGPPAANRPASPGAAVVAPAAVAMEIQEDPPGARDGPKAGPPPVFTAADEAELMATKTKLASRAANRQISPALAETATLEISLAPDAPAGVRELRLKAPNGLSNPLVFCVGLLPEITGAVVTATTNSSERPNLNAGPPTNPPRPAEPITLPAVVNGQILPGAVDHFRFAARKGQRITAAVTARALIPYLADAVPGWFQAILVLTDTQGRELAYNDHFRFDPDPVVSCEIPADGDYRVEIRDAIYRGREDFVYRLTIGELPFVTAIFPLGGPVGGQADFELSGWNLPSSALTLDTRGREPGISLLVLKQSGMRTNAIRYALDALPEVREAGPHHSPESAQPLTLPVIVNGRIERPDDRDVFRFQGRAGDEVVAEVFARRLGSPLDSALALTDATGHRLAFNDDYDDKGEGLLTHQADSRVSFTLPGDGAYFLTLTDAQHQGGTEFSYRLHVGPPRPDFELRIAPSSLNLRGGTSTVVTVWALRHDGFNGEIMLGLRDAPAGFALSGARIPANQDKVQLTLSAPPAPSEAPFNLTVIGLAVVQGRTVTHVAVPADDMMQAFFYRQLVPARDLKVVVSGRGGVLRVLSPTPVRLPAGGTAHLRVATGTAPTVANVQLELSEPPEGISIKQSSSEKGVVDVLLLSDSGKVKPGLAGNLILSASGERPNAAPPKGASAANRTQLGVVPAIPFEIVAAPPNNP